MSDFLHKFPLRSIPLVTGIFRFEAQRARRRKDPSGAIVDAVLRNLDRRTVRALADAEARVYIALREQIEAHRIEAEDFAERVHRSLQQRSGGVA